MYCKSLICSRPMLRRLKEEIKSGQEYANYLILTKHGLMYRKTTSNELYKYEFYVKT